MKNYDKHLRSLKYERDVEVLKLGQMTFEKLTEKVDITIFFDLMYKCVCLTVRMMEQEIDIKYSV